jgi:hypothetical protein
MLAPRQTALHRRMGQAKANVPAPRLLTFDGLIAKTTFIQDLHAMLATLQRAYQYHVDVEFAATLRTDGTYKINVVQCRPLQVHGSGVCAEFPEDIPAGQVLLASTGPVIGRSRAIPVSRIIYVAPESYGVLPLQDRHAIARLIGLLTHAPGIHDAAGGLLLAGPGRWGTASPDLGIPVHFTEIETVETLCEIVAMREDLVPDVSMGTHFFSELVEADMLYLALFPEQIGHRIDLSGLPELPLTQFAGIEATRWAHVVKIYAPESAQLHADAVGQRALLYRDSMT